MPFLIDLPNSGATAPTPNGPRSWDRPFDDLTQELVFTQGYIQSVDTFAPTALDTPHDDTTDAYLVSEGPRENIGGFYKWSRTYARIPPSRQIFEGYSWLVPGIGTGAVFSPQSITSIANAAGVTTIECAGDTTAVVNDSVSIAYTFIDAITGTQYGRTVIRTVLSGGGSSFGVALITEPGGSLYFLTAKKIEPGRPAEALEIGSTVQLDYYLPGVSTGIATPFDIPILTELQIYDGNGVKVDSFAADTAPSVTEWRASIAAGANICVVASIVRRWQGNIYERATRYCVAR